MDNKKIIKNSRIPLWAVPLRVLYRMLKRILPSRHLLKEVNLDGLKYLVWANEDIGKKLILLRSFEKFETETFKRLVRKGDVCIDVGGNVGYYALNLAKFAGQEGKVYVFEPIHRNALMINLALELNEFMNVDVIESAVSDVAGTVTLSIPSVDGAYAYISNTTTDDKCGEREQNVSCVTLDEFVSQHVGARVDIIKIDVEGAEGMVIKGGSALFSDDSRKPRVIMVELVSEFLGRFGSSINEIVDYLKEYGYQPFYAKSGNELTPFCLKDYDKVFNVFFISKM